MYTSTEDLLSGMGILLAVFIVSFVGAIQGYNQERGLIEVVLDFADREIVVVRNGDEMTISVLDVVVGDIISLRPGEILPVDGLIVSGHGIRVNESMATGEDIAVHKGLEARFLIGYSKVMAGQGRMLALSTGLDTTYGQIVKAMEDLGDPPTVLSMKLVKLANRIGYLGLFAGVVVFLALTIAYLMKYFPLYDNAFRNILNFFIMGLTIIVVAVPEGLPLALVLTQVTAMKALLKERVLVKKVQTLEQLGEVTAIVGHKTGLLTMNVLNVTRGWFYGTMCDDVPNIASLVGHMRRDLLARCISLNSDASIRYTPESFKVFRGLKNPLQTSLTDELREEFDMKSTVALKSCDLIGSRTEVALLHMLRINVDVDYGYVRKTGGEYVYRENFTPARRKVTTVYGPDSSGSSTAPLLTLDEGGSQAAAVSTVNFPGAGKYMVYMTGAPEAVCGACAVYMNNDGALVPIDARRRDTINGMVDLLAHRGLRPIACAIKSIELSQAPEGHDGTAPYKAWSTAFAAGTVETGLTLIAIFGLRDPLQSGIGGCVRDLLRGGIKVRLATGEHPVTAKTLADRAGITSHEGVCIDGPTWRAMAPEERTAVVPRLEVLSRALPADKLSLVKALQEVGEVVIATGDDYLTVAAADIGTAMGDWSPMITQDAAAIVVQDGTFLMLVRSILWGRCVLENVRRFLTFQLTINAVAITLTLISSFTHQGANIPFPLESIQLLWINLIMDSLGALMLSTEAPDSELLHMPPTDKRQPLITRTMIKQVGLISLIQLGVLLGLLLTSEGAAIYGFTAGQTGSRIHCTAIYNTFVFLQVFNFFNVRRIHDQANIHHGLARAKMGLILLGGISGLQIIWVMVGGDTLKTKALGAAPLLISIAIGFLSPVIGVISRLIPFRDKFSIIRANTASAAVLPLPPSLVNTIRSGTMRSTLNFSSMGSPRNTARSNASSITARSNAGRTDRSERDGLMETSGNDTVNSASIRE
jgi:Ca2+-transporting ATPase